MKRSAHNSPCSTEHRISPSGIPDEYPLGYTDPEASPDIHAAASSNGQAVFADVHVASARAASPVVRFPLRDRVLEVVKAREVPVFQSLHLVIHRPLALPERP